VFAHGSVVSWAAEWKGEEDELLKSCMKTYEQARQRDAEIIYDSIGVGASAGAKFAELNAANPKLRKLVYSKFNAGGAVYNPEGVYQPGTKNKDMFSNIKSQAWWLVADRFRNTYNAVRKGETFRDDELISIASDCPHLGKLIDELSTPKRDYDANGRVKVESKKGIIFNPRLATDFVWRRFVVSPPPNTVVRKINYTEKPVPVADDAGPDRRGKGRGFRGIPAHLLGRSAQR